jgi:hypothetical protein
VALVNNTRNGFKERFITDARKLGFKTYERNDKVFIYDRQLCEYLHQFGKAPDKFVPREIKEFPREELEIFLNAFLEGDGSKDQRVLYTSSRHLADDFQEIVMKLGKRCRIKERHPRQCFSKKLRRIIGSKRPQFELYITKRRHIWWESVQREVLSYTGKASCIEVPNHTMYVRRSGKPTWCGNTGGALKKALDLVEEPNFYCFNVDDVTFYDPGELFVAQKLKNALLIKKAILPFGAVEFAPDMRVLHFVEKPAIDKYVSCGHYVFNKEQIVPFLPDIGDLEQTLLKDLATSKLLQAYILKGRWVTINTMKDLLEARKRMTLE